MNKKIHIPISEIEFSKLSLWDENGRVFSWEGRIFRAIKETSRDAITELFLSGFLPELITRGLFVNSWITDYTIDNYSLVIEHEKVPIVIYPYEWSFSMFRDAALLVLNINIIGKQYGYQTKDCHGYNVLFSGTKPLFIDLGSFIKVEINIKGWQAAEEFVRYYYHPLRIWAGGNEYLARRILATSGEKMPISSYLYYQYPLCRFINIFLLNKFFKFYFKFISLASLDSERIKQHIPAVCFSFLNFLKKYNMLPFQNFILEKWLLRITRMKRRKYKTFWSNYQRSYFVEDGTIKSTPRYDRVLSIVESLQIRSLVELAGNQGVFSMLASQKLNIEKVICTDLDENAIDSLYAKLKESPRMVYPILLNFIYPFVNYYDELPHARFQCEAVVALSVTHHLILTQGIPLDHIFKLIARYSTKYILVDFMPLGLFDGKKAPAIPSWYSQEWFREEFMKNFLLLSEEKLEENRILFVGQLRNST